MAVVFQERSADANGNLLPARRATRYRGAKVRDVPDGTLTGGGDAPGSVTGYTEIDVTQSEDGSRIVYRPDAIVTTDATQTPILSFAVPDGVFRIRHFLQGVSIASGVYEIERIIVAVIGSGALVGGTLKRNTTLGTDVDDMSLGGSTLAVGVAGGVMTWKVTGKAATSIKWQLVADVTFNEGA